MPLPGLHPSSRTPSLDSPEQLRQLCLQTDAEETYYGVSGSEDGSNKPPARMEDAELNELLNLNASIYDLTVQYSCLAVHRCGGSIGFPSLISILMLEVLNVYVQMSIVFAVSSLVAAPAKAHANHLYQLFTDQCYESNDRTWNQDVADSWAAWDDNIAKSELCQYPLTAPSFFFLILLIWTFYLMHELKQTIYFWGHLMKLPLPTDDGRVTFLYHEDNFIITHMGYGLKVWTTVTVFLPKLIIAVVLWYIGAGWLTATEGIDNLVLNSLALTFICEVDELMFRACISEVVKSCLDKTKLPLPGFKYTPTIWLPAETLGTCLSCIALSYGYMYYLQDAVPDFRWDLTTVCTTHQKESLHHLLKMVQ